MFWILCLTARLCYWQGDFFKTISPLSSAHNGIILIVKNLNPVLNKAQPLKYPYRVASWAQSCSHLGQIESPSIRATSGYSTQRRRSAVPQIPLLTWQSEIPLTVSFFISLFPPLQHLSQFAELLQYLQRAQDRQLCCWYRRDYRQALLLYPSIANKNYTSTTCS